MYYINNYCVFKRNEQNTDFEISNIAIMNVLFLHNAKLEHFWVSVENSFSFHENFWFYLQSSLTLNIVESEIVKAVNPRKYFSPE